MSENEKNQKGMLENTDTIKIDTSAVESILHEGQMEDSAQEDVAEDLWSAQDDAPNATPATHIAKKEKTKKDKQPLTPQQKKGMFAGVVAGVIALVVIAGILLRMHFGKEDDSLVGYAEYGTVQTSISGEGYTSARKRQEVGQDMRGTITGVLVEVGDVVEEGDVLFEIDPTETQKELKNAQDELKTLQSNLNEAKANLNTAQTNANTVKNSSTQKNVTAPFSGKIVPVENGQTFTVGQYINAGTVIGMMVDDSSMKLPVYFNVGYKNTIQTGQTATVSIPSTMGTLTGTVSAVDSAGSGGDGVSSFRVVITVSNSGNLTKGMLATATVSTGAEDIYPIDSGTLQYNREESVTATASGEIKSVNGLAYNTYGSGDVIMKIGNNASASDTNIAQSAVTSAQSMVTSAQRLVTEKQRTITQLQKVIKEARIEAPISGTVVSLTGQEGQTMNGDPVAVVADMDEVVVTANIPATQVADVTVGQTAIVTMQLSDRTLEVYGSVISVALESDKTLGVGASGVPLFPAVIELYSLDETLRSDYPVKYKIILEEETDTLVVPSEAIVQTEEGPAVLAKPLLVEGEKVPFTETYIIPEGVKVPKGYELVPVEIGISDGTNTQILWGIEEGTQVYLAPPSELVSTPEDVDVQNTNDENDSEEDETDLWPEDTDWENEPFDSEAEQEFPAVYG